MVIHESKSSDLAHSASELIGSVAAAKMLGVNKTTLHRWTHSGKITAAYKAAGATGVWLYPRAEIEALAALAKPKVSL